MRFSARDAHDIHDATPKQEIQRTKQDPLHQKSNIHPRIRTNVPNYFQQNKYVSLYGSVSKPLYPW